MTGRSLGFLAYQLERIVSASASSTKQPREPERSRETSISAVCVTPSPMPITVTSAFGGTQVAVCFMKVASGTR